MIVTLDNVQIMEKEIKEDKEKNQVYIFNCYQKGEKSLIAVKGVPQEVYSSVEEDKRVSLRVKLMAWGQNGNYGLAVRYIDILDVKK